MDCPAVSCLTKDVVLELEKEKDMLKANNEITRLEVQNIFKKVEKINARLDAGAEKMQNTQKLIYVSMALGIVVEIIAGVLNYG